ncbi:MAG: hypothetical protein HYW89_03185 [Candidatus Sungiibacteriota bacterium]|uniref:Uncharacterized protein n=1 Tax=Candidatus Sungiibacteriota bacterium TaxID=2750080 RepID=A0A7T5RIZ6_9BACT|nr:MAG: hypothetical protein HYW89_03185 [Candidatus Sungbacteria bacterium]
MKKVLILSFLLLLGLGLWLAGNQVDEWDAKNKLQQERAETAFQDRLLQLRAFPDKVKKIDQFLGRGKLKEAQKETAELLKNAPVEFVSSLKYREAEINYRLCEQRLINFIFFVSSHTAENPTQEQAAEERDRALSYCDKALEIIKSLKPQTKEEELYYQYGRGNLEVRRAALAASQEEFTETLKRAMEAYVQALVAKDDYQTKFNLELLIWQFEKSGGGGSNNQTPADLLKLKPVPGAGPGRLGKSKL